MTQTKKKNQIKRTQHTHRCGHCKALAPAWNELGDAYAGSSSVIIGDVDCTVEESVCNDFEVRGYPTLKYFTAETGPKGEDYNSGRDLDSLKASPRPIPSRPRRGTPTPSRSRSTLAAHARTREAVPLHSHTHICFICHHHHHC